jgi:mannose-6-phosphate isomerase-like protein (cupin superfamily)
MPVQFIDVLKEPELELGHSKKVLFSSEQFHTWIHGDYPGTKGPMHKHTADQFFFCAQGQCTFHFPDGSSRAIGPGQMMLIPKGHLYQLDNTGDEYMILLGARAEPAGNPRFGKRNEKVAGNTYALDHRDKIEVSADKG